ncbi:MAG: hypothetical protein COA91_10090 [Robiginitomaculum sp.]|nr:MAG: hypothetical protein COA91_10090 [Robiginitomaculum sp.]
MLLWLKDFEIKDKKIRVKATGAELDLGLEITREVLSWFPFYFYEKARKLGALFSKNPHLTIAYSPVQPRPWYLLPVLAYRARLKNTKDYTKADIVVYFEDETKVSPPQIPAGFTGKTLNFDCYDISKSRVAQVFEQVFGYGLAVDPLLYKGPIAVKSERNGAHDGYVAQGPLSPKQIQHPDLVFQRLIDNSVDNKWVEDLRCPIIGGEIALIFVKRRPLASRFANANSSVTLREPSDLLSKAERGKLKTFAAVMGLDQGGLDVLRDKKNGKIYVVDVNKTDMGPPLALSIADKSKAVAILTKQFIKLIHD